MSICIVRQPPLYLINHLVLFLQLPLVRHHLRQLKFLLSWSVQISPLLAFYGLTRSADRRQALCMVALWMQRWIMWPRNLAYCLYKRPKWGWKSTPNHLCPPSRMPFFRLYQGRPKIHSYTQLCLWSQRTNLCTKQKQFLLVNESEYESVRTLAYVEYDGCKNEPKIALNMDKETIANRSEKH